MIREIQPKDCEQYLLLLLDLYKLENVNIEKELFWKTYEKIKNNGGIIYVLEDTKHKILGSVKIQNEIKFFDNIVHIEDVIIKDDYRNKGIGKLLLKEVLKYIPECYKVILQCKDTLRPFYEKCGFKEEGVHMCKRNINN